MRFATALARAYALFPFGRAFCVGDDFYIHIHHARIRIHVTIWKYFQPLCRGGESYL